MKIKWTEDLSTGVNEIDNQHKELFERLDSLLAASKNGKGKSELGKIISFLGDYVITHFGTEEKYMDKYNYPDSKNHKEIHNSFVKDFLVTKETFEKSGETLSLVVEIQQKLVNWLINHIKKVDKLLGEFLKKKIS